MTVEPFHDHCGWSFVKSQNVSAEDNLQGARELLRNGAFDGLRDNIRCQPDLSCGYFGGIDAMDYTLHPPQNSPLHLPHPVCIASRHFFCNSNVSCPQEREYV